MLMDSNGQRRISGICRALHFAYLGPRLLSVFELIIQDVVDCHDDKVVSQSVDGRGREGGREAEGEPLVRSSSR